MRDVTISIASSTIRCDVSNSVEIVRGENDAIAVVSVIEFTQDGRALPPWIMGAQDVRLTFNGRKSSVAGRKSS